MERELYVSRLREVLRERGLTVSDLHRTLTARGHRVSRTALDRVTSHVPIAGARLGVLLPVVTILDVDIRELFRPVSAEEGRERRRVHDDAAELLRLASPSSPSGPRTLSARAEASYDAAITQATGALRSTRPDLFDARGRPRKRAIARMIAEATAGRTDVSGGTYDAILGRAAAVIASRGA